MQFNFHNLKLRKKTNHFKMRPTKKINFIKTFFFKKEMQFNFHNLKLGQKPGKSVMVLK